MTDNQVRTSTIMGKDRSQFDEDENIDKRQESLRDQGIAFHYDRREREELREDRRFNPRPIFRTRRGLFLVVTILISCVVLVVFYFFQSYYRFGGEGVSFQHRYKHEELSLMARLHYQENSEESRLHLEIAPQSKIWTNQQALNLRVIFENNAGIVVEEKVSIPEGFVIQKDRPVPYLLYISRGEHVRSTRLRIISEDLNWDERKNLQ